ncbi:MAG: tRNA lysidine(34) synthetase TilS [Pigmentiphaga sp.]|uniref:tRNA lysidine(34) synthetase TilS n=1 Tax=Pigmentiphaga sp. TaxID=1977564 RepID=UPI0029BAF2EA|nr:tRNA lysidine(34) synthetase TilS [Pigmentiphaga sp.]MDX3907723.1 tRNA lysidine(34) synthetase TilS [Pigmentiphaga sp.]
MGVSRKPSSPDASPDVAALHASELLDRALDELPPVAGRFAVGVSAGPDSAALAVKAADWAQRRGLQALLFHVHHGLHPDADTWEDQAGDLARRLGLPCVVRRVSVDPSDPAGIEAAAREARYRALAEMATEAGVDTVLLAHHLDDQAETVLLRLLRGAGPDGMAAMARETTKDGIRYLRPWLGVPRSRILAFMQAYTARTGFQAVRDPSNLDARHARGILRTEILPAIERHWPGYRTTLERHARRSAEAAAVLREVAHADLEAIQEARPPYGNALRLSGLNRLSPARRAMALRLWLASQDMAAPSETRLREMARQLQDARQDRQVLLRHGNKQVRRYRDHVIVDSKDRSPPALQAASVDFRWTGEASVRLAAMGGTLLFVSEASGIDPAWLRNTELTMRRRRGRERLRLSPQSPSRSLKNLYQERGIPSWERERLPLLYGGDTLVYAAGLGSDARLPQSSPGIRLEWRADHPGATVTS